MPTPVDAPPTDYRTDAKQAAIDQWTADPCGPDSQSPPGSRAYIEELVEGRRDYAPWMDEALGYAQTAGRRVLDVGCGQGIDVVRYAQAGAHAAGIDLTPRHVQLAREHAEALGLDVDVREGDAEAMPFEDSTFDRVSSNGVLHHTPDIAASLREVRRVLKPGGEARIILYNRRSLHYWVEQVLDRGVIRGGLWRERSMGGVLSSGVERSSVGARPLVRVYSPRAVRRLMREAGFVDVSTEVHHFRPENTRITGRLARRFPALADPRLCERIGRVAGWYVVGRGVAPPGPSR